MRELRFAVMVVAPLLLAACGSASDEPAAAGTPAPTAQAQPAPSSTPPDTTASVPLRLTPEGLLGFPGGTPAAPPPTGAPAVPPPTSAAPVNAAPPPATTQEPPDDTPSEVEVRALYEGIMYTYAFDACGLPLIGERARQDIEQRIEVCPNPPLRKDAFRTVYHRALEIAQQDPEKMRASAGKACPDKREFLRRVMSHASELAFDDSQPSDCGLLSLPAPGAPPANPAATASGAARAGKPF